MPSFILVSNVVDGRTDNVDCVLRDDKTASVPSRIAVLIVISPFPNASPARTTKNHNFSVPNGTESVLFGNVVIVKFGDTDAVTSATAVAVAPSVMLVMTV